jgi:hypothetical protein
MLIRQVAMIMIASVLHLSIVASSAGTDTVVSDDKKTEGEKTLLSLYASSMPILKKTEVTQSTTEQVDQLVSISLTSLKRSPAISQELFLLRVRP